MISIDSGLPSTRTMGGVAAVITANKVVEIWTKKIRSKKRSGRGKGTHRNKQIFLWAAEKKRRTKKQRGNKMRERDDDERVSNEREGGTTQNTKWPLALW